MKLIFIIIILILLYFYYPSIIQKIKQTSGFKNKTPIYYNFRSRDSPKPTDVYDSLSSL